MSNQLNNQTSPYLLQHAENPVNWYPWCEEAFQRARLENKPVFLSIGYSTCHWCHVMAHESFENPETAALLNEHFISIKVDKEERPDIDSVYMAACIAFNGSGGWPLNVFLTPDQKPFFAGTYFPPKPSRGLPGFQNILNTVIKKWNNHHGEMLSAADRVAEHLSQNQQPEPEAEGHLIKQGVQQFIENFDKDNGGFGISPKFPTPHNLLFLLEHYRIYGQDESLKMAEKTLLQLYKGGIFDHIGYGFSRYSTDNLFLVPHFEKMLYDNALLIMAYAKAYETTKDENYKKIAQQTIEYITSEMTAPEGGFYTAQDADSDGVEGKYYLFSYEEVLKVLGEESGKAFCRQYGITDQGNFEGKNIPNLLHHDMISAPFFEERVKLYHYRKERNKLHLDDKILLGQNCLMIGALCQAYQVFGHEAYLEQAKKAMAFIQNNLKKEDTLYVSFRETLGTTKGFLEEYAQYVFALIHLYTASLEIDYLTEAQRFLNKTMQEFFDKEKGGFFLYGSHNERLISLPKQAYDGATPSGNSIMAYNLVKLWAITQDERIESLAKEQLQFLSGYGAQHPMGHSFYLYSLLLYENPKGHITVVLKNPQEREELDKALSSQYDLLVYEHPTEQYPLLNGKTTYYVCTDFQCLPPTNDLQEVLS